MSDYKFTVNTDHALQLIKLIESNTGWRPFNVSDGGISFIHAFNVSPELLLVIKLSIPIMGTKELVR